MNKPLRVLIEVAERDLPDIAVFHAGRSLRMARAILAEYDRCIALLQRQPRAMRVRAHGWRIYPFRNGGYALYYCEAADCWLVAGVFHAARDPDWIQAQLVIRESREQDEIG